MTTTTQTTDWRAYQRMEMSMAFKPYHGYGLGVLCLIGLMSSLLLPLMPQTVYDLLTKGFQLKGWTQVIVFNDFISIFAIAFWLGIFDLFRIYILPAEERYLDIYLSKPLPRSRYLMSRLVPSAAIMSVLLLVSTVLYIAKIALINGMEHFNVFGFAMGSLFTWGLTLFLLATANLVFLFLKEMYHAIIASFAIWLIPILPTVVLVYRPDILVAKPQMKPLLYPANLLWFEQHALLVGALGTILCLGGTAGMVWLAVQKMERTDLL